MSTTESNLVTNLAKGALAGVAGVWLMDRLGWGLWNRENRRALAREQEARIDGMDPAHVAANRIAKAFGRQLEPRQPHPAGIVVHYALGVAPAMLYAVLRHGAPRLTTGRGLLYGLGLFLLVDELAAPSMRLAAWAPAYPWQAHARGLASHLVLGAAIDGGVRALDAATPGSRRSGEEAMR